jgi:hypothetical protein
MLAAGFTRYSAVKDNILDDYYYEEDAIQFESQAKIVNQQMQLL